MSQFDVHRNIGKQSASIPFVVVVQSGLFDAYRRRIVVPLVRRAATGTVRASRLNPSFIVEGVELVLHPLELVSLSLDQLGAIVGSLKDDGQVITDALDEVFTRSWG